MDCKFSFSGMKILVTILIILLLSGCGCKLETDKLYNQNTSAEKNEKLMYAEEVIVNSDKRNMTIQIKFKEKNTGFDYGDDSYMIIVCGNRWGGMKEDYSKPRETELLSPEYNQLLIKEHTSNLEDGVSRVAWLGIVDNNNRKYRGVSERLCGTQNNIKTLEFGNQSIFNEKSMVVTKQFNIIYRKRHETYIYSNSLPVRVLLTPFSVLFDIITLPFRFLICPG